MSKSPQEKLARLRRDYTRTGLSKADSKENPFDQFSLWMSEAVNAELLDANCMTLSTVGTGNQPSSRIVLLKDYNEEGFTFYTNYLSRKGKELADFPKACLQFYWAPLERQVHIEGQVQPVDRAVSEAYFALRPRDAQLGAWASAQSEPISGRADLDLRYARYEKEFEGQDIPCPAHWGGYLLTPHNLSFWQGRASRMHDRMVYELGPNGWFMQRLAP